MKRAIDLQNSDPKILKLVFCEKFTSHIGGIAFECLRSPRKEARILDLVAGHKNFMQGCATMDRAGNLLRMLDVIKGQTLYAYVEKIGLDHETYFFEGWPGLLINSTECIRVICLLHEHGEKHGGIRRDHILIDRHNGRWAVPDGSIWTSITAEKNRTGIGCEPWARGGVYQKQGIAVSSEKEAISWRKKS